MSTTGIESVKSVASIFKIVEDRESLLTVASRHGFEAVGAEENYLPNGKSLLTYEFHKLAQVAGTER